MKACPPPLRRRLLPKPLQQMLQQLLQKVTL
jgi:hypothetical protein